MNLSEIKNLAPADLDEAGQVLLKAAQLIEDRGLAKGALQQPDGRLCINGALSVVIRGFPHPSCVIANSPAYTRLYNHFGEDPSFWNNAPERTKEEVVAKLRALAFSKE